MPWLVIEVGPTLELWGCSRTLGTPAGLSAYEDRDVPYRVAATENRAGQPAGELHAYRPGLDVTLCGRALGDDVYMFVGERWDERPASVSVCPICGGHARPPAA